MSARRIDGGRLIDRTKPLRFTFNGRKMEGFQGDTLASALLANGQMLVGRSFKYHRPRGIVTAGPEEPNALVNLGKDKRFEPNARATTTELFDGLEARSQNHWPSLERDIGVLNDRFARFLPAGFYYKTFIHPRPFWKHVFEPFIRQSAGLGQAPRHRDGDTYEHVNVTVDVLVSGGGISGLAAALAAGKAGARVLLVEQSAHWGGRLDDAPDIDGQPAETWVAETVAALTNLENVTVKLRTTHSGVYDHGYCLAVERLTDHDPLGPGPRQRLWKVRAGRIVAATGAIERPLSFAGNDLPGVMLAAAVRDYLTGYGVAPGRRTVVVTNNDDGYRTAFALKDQGLEVPLILDARSDPGPVAEAARELGLKVAPGKGLAGVSGKGRVEKAAVAAIDGSGAVLDELACDCIAMAGGWSPAVHLWSHAGGKLHWDETDAMFVPDPDKPPLGADGKAMVRCVGAAAGELGAAEALETGWAAGLWAATETGHKPKRGAGPKAEPDEETPIAPVWVMPRGADPEKRAKMWLDYQNDVKVSDVELAQREGYESVEHTKRYTTLGMATDQGKLSNINGLAVLADARGEPIPAVGTTTFRPPYTPLTMGAIAGEARGDLFQPIRRTPMHEHHERMGAHWEPVGHWRRPYAFPRSGESVEEAVNREIVNTRQNVGLLDASTLGKILVKGPDAARFLDMLYTGMMSSLKPGRCRYGLMCSENGFLIDDGVVARIDEDTFLCHTTTGGADRIHAHMEEWLQTEWWDWQVHTLNITEAWAQIGVVGPKARDLLEALGGMDLSEEALPFMSWADGEIGGFKARIYRISFSGELSYEIAVDAGHGAALWEACLDAGESLGVMPYGTEALHVMRAEKGFIMIGDETDGTVIPQDLGLSWAISKKKDDYLGKRAQDRLFMTDPNRWKLVGLETLDGSVLPEGAYAVDDSKNANGQRETQGRVTSTYYSPSLKRGIAMGLVRHGPDRMGEVLTFPGVDGTETKARIVEPVFLKEAGA
ncbi:MAG: sarcosine oxidase subunit alpha family protein [Paracoccaceae bacterium]|nr:sarcosine oxidase subunit alpha family protein [Paracoccaceae bacterium]